MPIPSCAARVPIFQALSDESLAELASTILHHHYAKGEVVLASGEQLQYLFVVAAGRLKVTHLSSSGREQIVRILEPGDFTGELALFTPTYQEGDLVAIQDTDVCQIPSAAVQAVLRRHPSTAFRLVEELALRLAAAEQFIADLGLKNVGQRLAAELLRLTPEGTASSSEITLQIPISWAELAAQLGTTPESLSRQLKLLTANGLIRQVSNRTVIIIDANRLQAYIES